MDQNHNRWWVKGSSDAGWAKNHNRWWVKGSSDAGWAKNYNRWWVKGSSDAGLTKIYNLNLHGIFGETSYPSVVIFGPTFF